MKNLIEWPRAKYWDKAWNPIVGCYPVSPACDNCYACAMIRRFTPRNNSKPLPSLTLPHFTSRKKPPTKGVVFAGNMTDLFGEWVPIRQQFEIFSRLWHFKGRSGPIPNDATYLFLTKRPKRMLEALREYAEMPHAFFGFTAENEDLYLTRNFDFSQNRPSKIRWWISLEPLLGPIELMFGGLSSPSWVVVGCESGPYRRPCRIEWVRDIVRICLRASVPVFVKQLDIDGKCVTDINKFPEDLRIRQVPWRVEE